jgi:hypothetical protein
VNVKVIYVAGPFRSPHQWGQQQNVMVAMALALEVWQRGHAAICPHSNTMFFQDAAPDDVWLDGDLAILGRCDGVLMTPDWRASRGATEERRVALEAGLPVFETVEELDRWLAA